MIGMGSRRLLRPEVAFRAVCEYLKEVRGSFGNEVLKLYPGKRERGGFLD